MNLEDIAKKTNLSVSTVSRAMNNKPGVNARTREAVLEAINQTNDKRLKTKIKSATDFNHIAIITPSFKDIYYITEIIQLITDEAAKNNLLVSVFNASRQIKNEIELINYIKTSSHIHGLILLSSSQKPDYPLLKNALKGFKKPFILLHNEIAGLNVSGIYINKTNLSYDITRKYIVGSFKDIAIIVGPEDSDSAINRVKGYKLAFEENNIPINDNFIVYSDWKDTDIILQSCHQLFNHATKPKVILCGNEDIILNLISYCNSKNIAIGKNVQIASFHHNELFRKLGYKIPDYDAKLDLMATYAIEQLMEQYTNPNYTTKKIELIAKV